jgi:hypothetical protein
MTQVPTIADKLSFGSDAGPRVTDLLGVLLAEPQVTSDSTGHKVPPLEDGKTLRVLGFPDQFDALGPIGASLGAAKEKLAAARDKTAAKTLVAVTDRRIITAKTNALLEQSEIRQDVPIDRVRYVRLATPHDESGRLAIDLITRDENTRWLFHADIGNTQLDALAAAAESIRIHDGERDELQRQHHAPIEAGKKCESTGKRYTKPTGSEATTCDAE